MLPVVSSLSVAKSAPFIPDNGQVGVSRQGSLDSCSESQSQSNTTAEESGGDGDSLPPTLDSEDGLASPSRTEKRTGTRVSTSQSSSAFQQGVDDRGCLPSGIILAPTRELVCQINIEAKKLCHNSNIKSVVIYGGTDVRTQLFELSSGCDIIVATPGRLFDLVERGVISFCKVSFLILDEADRMLDMGFEVKQLQLQFQLHFHRYVYCNVTTSVLTFHFILFRNYCAMQGSRCLAFIVCCEKHFVKQFSCRPGHSHHLILILLLFFSVTALLHFFSSLLSHFFISLLFYFLISFFLILFYSPKFGKSF